MDERSWTVAAHVPLRPWRLDDAPVTSDPPDPPPCGNIEELKAQVEAAERRAETAERDRDWWMGQHDAVMKDWRLDIAILQPKGVTLQPASTPTPAPAEPAPAAAPPAALIFAEPVIVVEAAAVPDAQAPATDVVASDDGLRFLADLLQFFDPRDGSITFQREGRTLSEAFRQAASWIRKAKI